MMNPDNDLILDMDIPIIAGINYAFIGHLFGTWICNHYCESYNKVHKSSVKN